MKIKLNLARVREGSYLSHMYRHLDTHLGVWIRLKQIDEISKGKDTGTSLGPAQKPDCIVLSVFQEQQITLGECHLWAEYREQEMEPRKKGDRFLNALNFEKWCCFMSSNNRPNTACCVLGWTVLGARGVEMEFLYPCPGSMHQSTGYTNEWATSPLHLKSPS